MKARISIITLSMVVVCTASLNFTGCVQNQMSVDKAQNVVLTMQNKSLAPPPRSTIDILSFLDNVESSDQEKVQQLYMDLNEQPPKTDSKSVLSRFYLKRGIAARELGKYRQAHDDLTKSVNYMETAKNLKYLGTIEYLAGSYTRAVDFAKKSMALTEPKNSSSLYFNLALYYASMGDFQACEAIVEKGVQLVDGLPDSGGRTMNKNRAIATLYNAKGEFEKAEKYMRNSVEWLKGNKRLFPLAYLHNKGRLDMIIAHQGRLIEAEISARETIKESIALTGRLSGTSADVILNLGQILLMQGRVKDAKKLIDVGLDNLSGSLRLKNSVWFGEARMKQVGVLTAAGDYKAAVAVLDTQHKDMAENRKWFVRQLARNVDALLALLMVGRTQEALDLINQSYLTHQKYLGENHISSAELRGLRGIAHFQNKMTENALSDFQSSIPLLVDELGHIENFQKKNRAKKIIESYISLLQQLWQTGDNKTHGIDTIAEIFSLSEKINDSTVQGVIGALGARAVSDKELQSLIRQEQDAAKRVEALNRVLTAIIMTPEQQRSQKAFEALQGDIQELRKARLSLQEEISSRYEKYSDFVRPQVPEFHKLQELLNPREVLLVLHQIQDISFVWAIPKSGKVYFHSVQVPQKTLVKRVNEIRKTVDPSPATLSDIPQFSFTSAHWIYNTLLAPIKDGWKDASDLIVVAPGYLGQIPFTLLLESEFPSIGDNKVQFSNYRNAPWLIKNYAISRLPSANSILALRQTERSDVDRLAFAGFGDPLFYAGQYEIKEAKTEIGQKSIATRGVEIKTRGVRITDVGMLDDKKVARAQLSDLIPLPDTADEILNISKALDGNTERDVFLGPRASEQVVKTVDLSNRRIIAFATHGLLPGDLDGLDQPALAFTSPVITGNTQDGVLKMSEIMQLKLNADWVVLSACNTGAGEGSGVEAVSGLAKAFFYAGSKALLVSMWPVETVSAKKLTTSIFDFQKKDKSLTRSRALQKAIVNLIENENLIETSSGEVVASYAHPLFWAPFIIAGDGGQ